MPTDITLFFGKKGGLRSKANKAGVSKKREADDDIVHSPKKPKVELGKSKGVVKKAKVVDEFDSLDEEIREIIPIEECQEDIEKPTKGVKKELQKEKKKETKDHESKKSIKSPETHLEASDILALIPDCGLPEVDATEKVNFWAKKAELDNQSSDDSFQKPEGRPDCLAGLTIVFTGVLPHLNREDCDFLAKKYGAKVTKSISKKTSVVVLGEDAGPSKIQKIKQFGIKHIDEAGFCQLIESMPEAGGDGNEAAAKVLMKREEEARKIEAEAIAEAKEAERREEEKQRRLQRPDSNGNVDAYIKPEDRPDSEKLWTVKYAPTKILQICGNKGAIQKMVKWFSNWDQNKKSKFKYFGESFPAVLISGPPGIGKTTAAHIVAKDLGYEIVEKNASDVRSKTLLNQTIRDILDNTSVVGFFNKSPKKLCLIMDEVDGMSSGDMGGVGALANFCRKTSIPIVLICNDKSLPKMRPFDKVTLDLQFRRPDATSIKSRILTIALREKIKVPPEIIERLVEYTKNDIRQIINLLSTVSKTTSTINSSNYEEVVKGWEKNIAMKTFDITGKFLSSGIWSQSSNVSLQKKIEYYFDDYSFVPLMIHENYLNTKPSAGSGLDHLKLVAKAADSISEADLVDRKIHSSDQQWSLMPFHGIMSSIRPSSFVNGQITGRINFTSFLGNNSKRNKYQRLLMDLNYHTKLATLTNKSELRLNYFTLLSKKVADPLLQSGAEGIPTVIDLLDDYYLTKDDWEYLLDFAVGPNNPYKFDIISKKIPSSVKSLFTRKYNTSKHPMVIFHVGVAGTGSKAMATETPDFEDAVNDDTTEAAKEDDDDQMDDDLSKDKLIKQKKTSAKKPAKPRKKPAAKKTKK